MCVCTKNSIWIVCTYIVLNCQFWIEFFTFAVLTVTWRLKRINLIGIDRIDLSYFVLNIHIFHSRFSVWFVWWLVVVYIFLCGNKRRITVVCQNNTQDLIDLPKHFGFCFVLVFSWRLVGGWWLVRICTHAFIIVYIYIFLYWVFCFLGVGWDNRIQ